MKVNILHLFILTKKTNTQKTVCYHINVKSNWNRNALIISNPLLAEMNDEVNDFNEGSVGPLKRTL